MIDATGLRETETFISYVIVEAFFQGLLVGEKRIQKRGIQYV